MRELVINQIHAIANYLFTILCVCEQNTLFSLVLTTK